MRAAVLHSISDMRLAEVDIPLVRSAEILLKVAYCGLCGLDVPRNLRFEAGGTQRMRHVCGNASFGVYTATC